jgi:hypothetical protein
MAGSNQIKIKSIGIQNNKWPILDNLWNFYEKKGIKTVFFSIGSSENAFADLEIAETLGCPIHIFEVRESAMNGWNEVQQILKSRKSPDSPLPFSEMVDTKWVLPKNIRIQNTLPGTFTGTMEIESTSYPVTTWEKCIQTAVSSMNLTEQRIDILKISLGLGIERSLLFSLLNTGFRPGLLLIDWTDAPDSNLFSTLCAGHLQNSGYTLLAKHGNHFLYFFYDRSVYELCSWEQNNVENPLVAEIVKAVSGTRT